MTAEPKRIAVFTRSLEGGGAERVAVNLANGFFAAGFDVDLILQYREGPYLPLVGKGIRIVELNRRVRYAVPRLVSYLRRTKPDAMLSLMTEPNLAAVLAWRLARLPGRLAVSEHSSLTGSGRMRMWSLKRLYPMADAIVAISRAMRMQMIDAGLPPDRVVVIHNPLPPELTSDIVAARRSPASSVPVILGIGRLAMQKDFETLIRAFDLLRLRRQCKLVILGEGDQRRNLEGLVTTFGLKDLVDMPGFINPPWDVIRKASVVAVSSRLEGWPSVLAEALALGVPVVSTDCPTGPSEILDDGHIGKLVPVGDSHALAEAIEWTLENPPDPERLQLRAQTWSLGSIVDDYLRALELRQ